MFMALPHPPKMSGHTKICGRVVPYETIRGSGPEVMALELCRRGMVGVIKRRTDGRVKGHSEVGGSDRLTWMHCLGTEGLSGSQLMVGSVR